MNFSNNPYIYYIPENFESSFNILGYNIKFINLFEGAVIAIVPLVLIIAYVPLDIGAKMWIYAFTALPCSLIAIKGVHGDSLTKRLSLIIKYRKKRRICIYNPRVKIEAMPTSFNHANQQMLPKEKLQMLYQNYKKKNREKIEQEIREAESNCKDNELYFMDDEGFTEKPLDYMTSSERRKYKKEQKKKEKAKLKHKKRENNSKKKKITKAQKKAGVKKDERKGQQKGKKKSTKRK